MQTISEPFEYGYTISHYGDEEPNPDNPEETIIPLIWSVRYIPASGEDLQATIDQMQVNYSERGDPTSFPLTSEMLLEQTRQTKLSLLGSEALNRLQAYWPSITSLDQMIPFIDLGPTLDMTKAPARLVAVKDIAQAGLNARDYLKDPARTQAQLDTFDAVTSPNWP